MKAAVHPHSAEEDPPDQHPPPSPPQKTPGGWKSVKYILGNESFEKLASMSLIANLTVYLRTKYNMDGILLVNVISIWSGSSNISSLAGAFVSDAYLGRFHTLLLGSMVSFLGMGTMTLTAGVTGVRSFPCNGQGNCPEPQAWQLALLYGGLGLLAIGAGGIRPCSIAFGADQFDPTTEKGRAQLQSFFNWWYFSFTLALLVALSVVVYIQTNVSWVLGFAIPTGCLGISIIIFLLGRHTYIFMKPQGSIFADMVKVVAAAGSKRGVSLDCEHTFYDPPSNKAGPWSSKLAYTDRFKYLDKAALIVDPSELDTQGKAKDGWSLCSVEQVEELKCLLAIFPVWISGITCFIVMDQQNTFGILQAIQTNRSIGHFEIPPGWLGIASMISLSIWIFMYEHIYIPQARKILRRDSRLTLQQRIAVGILMSILCMLFAGIGEGRRRHSALRNGSFTSPVSVAMLLPQFVLSGLTEAFAAVAIMEYFTTQMPDSMRAVAGAIFYLSLSITNYISSLLVNVIHAITRSHGWSPWLGGHDLNENRLDYYYYMIAVLETVNFLYFIFFASHYVFGSTACKKRREVQLDNSMPNPKWQSNWDLKDEVKTLEITISK